MTVDQIRSLLGRLIHQGHFSPFEHASFSFAVSGVSRALTHELVRHRIASYTQRSQRWLKETGFAYVTPPRVAANPEAERIYTAAMASLQRDYARLLELGIPREDARFVLPNACTSQIMVTMNARSLRNFFSLRCCARAQWEIRGLAREMLTQVRQVAPELFLMAGPPCETDGICREGELGCGKLGKNNDRSDRG